MAMIGILSFFIESSSSIFEVWFACFMLLSGYLVPLELFPDWVKTLTYMLPFRYMLGLPVEILIGSAAPDELAKGLAVQWAYALSCMVAALALWRANVRRFGAFSG